MIILYYTSESDIYSRQILLYKDGPCAERVKNYVSLCVINRKIVIIFLI